MADLGTLEASLGADLGPLRRDVNRAEGMFRKFTRAGTGAMRKVTGAVFSLQGAIAGLGLGLAARHFQQTAASFEQMEIKLNALSDGRGAEVLERINQWAIDMPVNTQKAVDVFAKMEAMGLNPNIEAMETLVDTATVFGEETLPRVARALGQMNVLGRVSAEELNQLAEAGINARKYLKEAFGTAATRELDRMKVTTDEAIKVIMEGLREDFGGAARDAMDMWQGVSSTFQSTIIEIERQFAEAGVFDAMKQAILDISNRLRSWLDHQKELREMGLPNWFDKAGTAAMRLADGVGDVFTALTKIDDLYNQYKPIIQAGGAGLIGAWLFSSGGAGVLVAGIVAVNGALSRLDAGLGDLRRKGGELTGIFQNIWEVFTGKRDPNTGELRFQVPDIDLSELEARRQEFTDLWNAPGVDLEMETPAFETMFPSGENFQAAKENMRSYGSILREELETAKTSVSGLDREFQYFTIEKMSEVYVPKFMEDMDTLEMAVISVGRTMSDFIGRAFTELADQGTNAASQIHSAWHSMLRSLLSQIAANAFLFGLANIFSLGTTSFLPAVLTGNILSAQGGADFMSTQTGLLQYHPNEHVQVTPAPGRSSGQPAEIRIYLDGEQIKTHIERLEREDR